MSQFILRAKQMESQVEAAFQFANEFRGECARLLQQHLSMQKAVLISLALRPLLQQ